MRLNLRRGGNQKVLVFAMVEKSELIPFARREVSNMLCSLHLVALSVNMVEGKNENGTPEKKFRGAIFMQIAVQVYFNSRLSNFTKPLSRSTRNCPFGSLSAKGLMMIPFAVESTESSRSGLGPSYQYG